MQEYLSFGYKGRTSDEFGVYLVSDGGTYERSLFPEYSDREEHVIGQRGTYYFGTDITSKPIPMTLYLDSITREQYLALQRWLRPSGELGNFYFFESIYKYWSNVRVTNLGNYGHFPFVDEDRNELFTGEVDLELKAYEPCAFSTYKTIEEGNLAGLNANWYDKSGILSTKYTLPFNYSNITFDSIIGLYNGGNEPSNPIITLKGTGTNITVLNINNNTSFKISSMNNEEIVIDCIRGRATKNGELLIGKHSGGFIKIEPTNTVKEYTNAKYYKNSNVIRLTPDNVSNTFTYDLISSPLSSELVGTLNKFIIKGNTDSSLYSVQNVNVKIVNSEDEITQDFTCILLDKIDGLKRINDDIYDEIDIVIGRIIQRVSNKTSVLAGQNVSTLTNSKVGGVFINTDGSIGVIGTNNVIGDGYILYEIDNQIYYTIENKSFDILNGDVLEFSTNGNYIYNTEYGDIYGYNYESQSENYVMPKIKINTYKEQKTKKFSKYDINREVISYINSNKFNSNIYEFINDTTVKIGETYTNDDIETYACIIDNNKILISGANLNIESINFDYPYTYI